MRATITADVPWVIDANDAVPVRRAIEDLSRDWQRVFSTPPKISGQWPDKGAIVAIGGGTADWLTGVRTEFPAEAHAVVIRPGRGPAVGRPVVCVEGGGARGLIYAIYAFSEQVLGVDPFWFWTDQELIPTDRIDLPSTFAHRRDTPTFRWRGWHVNDEDLLAAWAPSRSAAHGVALDAWDAIYETLLRVGGNFVVPGACVFMDEPPLALAAERGLAIGQHHSAPLGLNTERWPEEIPVSWEHNRRLLVGAWREGVLACGDREVLWSVGLRCRADHPFEVSGGDAGLGAMMTDVIAAQVDTVRKLRPHDDIFVNLCDKAEGLAEAGHLRLPEGISAVVPDDGHGQLRRGQLALGAGVFYHVALCDEVGSQLTEMVHPAKIAAELGRAIEAGSTAQLLLGVSDIRTHAMTSQLAMQLAWEGAADMDQLWLRWAARRVGRFGPDLKRLWSRYFEALWRFRDGQPDGPVEMGYHRMSRWILRAAAEASLEGEFPLLRPSPPGQPANLGNRTWRSFIERTERAASAAQPRLDALAHDAEEFIGRVPPERRGFVHDHLLTYIAIHQEGNRMLGAVARGVLLGNSARAREELEAAREYANRGLQVLRRGNRGRWQDWYRGEQYVRAHETLAMLDIQLERITRADPFLRQVVQPAGPAGLISPSSPVWR